MSSTLLYALRSPTTTLSAKLSLASSSLSLSSSGAPLVASQVRDWLLDTLLKSRKDDSSSTILSRPCWALLDHSLLTATGLGPTPPLPIFIAFLQRYSDQDESDADLVGSVGRVFARLAGGAMKKATVDAVLEGYAELVKASVKVVLRDNDDRRPWEDLADHWLKAFRTVADSGKAGKKIPLHTLANLPSIVALLPILSPDEPFLSALLQTLQFTLFNLENLRRGLARESYNAASSSADDAESASSELLNALKALLPTQSTLVQQALPTLFALYRTSLSTHATALFPLPAKTSFPTASAFRSATELHAFSKRRALAASWIRGARTLLQSLSASTPEADAHAIIAAILARLSTSSTTPWTGHAHGMTLDELPSALWELVTRRWLQTLEASASTEQLAQLAAIVVQCLSNPENPQEISLHATTARLLRRADFYELRRLQAQIHPSLLTLLSLPHLTSPTDVLSSLSLKKLPKALRALEASRVVEAVATFERVAKLVPMEYLGKGLRNDLIERALALDVWITSGQAGENAEGPAILAHLVNGTTTVDPATTKVTIDLYRHFVQSSVIVYTGDKLTAPLEAYLAAFESPLAALAKRAKKAPGPVAPDELAFFALCDVLSSSLGDFASVPEALRSTIETIVKAASKPLGKALVATTAAIVASPEAVWDCADLLDGCRRFWQLKDWISGTAEHDQVEPFAAFAQAALGVLVDHAAHPERLEVQPNSLRTCLAMLDLLGFRIARLRALSDPKKHATGPFETFLACHLAFRQGLRAVPGASAALLSNLKRATSTSTLREYAAALAGISAFIGETVASETAANQIASLEPALEVALVLLRDGPAGSSRLSTECLSDVLRHLSLLLTKLSPLVGEPVQGAALAEALLVVSTFIEGPMLLSRQNVSSVLALVARMLQPSGPLPALPASSTPTPASLTSSLWLSLVTTVDHLVRHRKDHISPLFPHLVATLAPMLLALRRAGFGTTGSSSSVALEDADVSVAVGKRAEREARATFPSWVWEGGAQGVGRAEAKAVGRLLASLSAKTTSSASLKRKHGATVDNAAATTTTSLAAPLSKHAPFILLPYLRACVNVAAPIPSALRSELQGGWFEVMDAMGKWEREALMKGFLGEEEEAEKGVLRGMWRTWEKERYRG
ncbi:hypothetical protein RQP46_003363 [Phenoliferia psychrophenolica]